MNLQRLPFAQLFIAVCSLTGCSSIQEVNVDPTTYVLFERDRVRPFAAVQIWTHTDLWFLPAPSKSYEMLAEVPFDERSAARLIAHAPPRRNLGASSATLWTTAAEMITKVQPAGESTQWIVANEPLVIALGKRNAEDRRWMGAVMGPTGTLQLGGRFQLPREADKGELVDELLIVDQWPTDEQGAELPIRRMKFGLATTLGNVLDNRSWETKP